MRKYLSCTRSASTHTDKEEKADHIFRLTQCYPFTSDFGNITLKKRIGCFQELLIMRSFRQLKQENFDWFENASQFKFKFCCISCKPFLLVVAASVVVRASFCQQKFVFLKTVIKGSGTGLHWILWERLWLLMSSVWQPEKQYGVESTSTKRELGIKGQAAFKRCAF